MRLDELTRPDFPILERVVNGKPLAYLDSGASSQKPRSVLEAMNRYYERTHANVHRSIHTLGEEATEIYEVARDRVQRFIGARHREEIIFTRGTTDGLSLMAETIGRTLRPGDEVLITELSTTRTSSPGNWRRETGRVSSRRFRSVTEWCWTRRRSRGWSLRGPAWSRSPTCPMCWAP